MRSNTAEDHKEAVNTLKPCPFCGNNPELRIVTRKGNGGCDLFSWRVICTDCNAQFPSIDDAAVRDENGIRLTVDGRERVTDMWNRRVGE